MKATKNDAATYTITLDLAAAWSDMQKNDLTQQLRALADKVATEGLAAFAELDNVTAN